MYTDAQIIGQFEMLKRACEARGYTVGHHLIVREKGTGRIVLQALSCVHAQGFLDGLDYAHGLESAASAENKNKTDQNRPAS